MSWRGLLDRGAPTRDGQSDGVIGGQRPAVAIEAGGLKVLFGATHALRSVDLQLGWGERLAVFGPNGAGKTTLIRVLSTLLRPSAGELHIAGFSMPREASAARRMIGVVAHQTYLYPELTASENLRYYGRLYHVSDLSHRIESVLEQVGLYQRRDQPVSSLSRGMQQRVAIARAVLHDPPILLLDEPDTGLDLQSFALLEAVLLGNQATPRSVVLTTHNLEHGLRLAGRVAILVEGSFVHQQPSQALDGQRLQDLYRSFLT